MASSVQGTLEEIESLRYRLQEAEETLHAIRRGEVDALVVDGPAGPQVFTLRGAEEPYRVLVEKMPQGALTLTPDGSIVYANRCFAGSVRLPLEQVIGREFRQFVSSDMNLIEEALRSGQLSREVAIDRGDGTTFAAIVAFSALPLDGVTGLCAIVTDLTEQKRAEAVAAAERLMRSILEQATDVMVVCDTNGVITHANFAAGRLASGPLVDRPFTETFALVAEASPRAAHNGGDPIALLIASASRGEPSYGMEVRSAQSGQHTAHFLMSAGPLYFNRREPAGCIVTLTNISERKRAEEQQKVLIAELNHRVKNNLAVVQSIVSQTMRTSPSLVSFEDALYGRLNALAVGHTALTETGWTQVDFAELVNQVIAPFLGDGGRGARVKVSGPRCSLSARGVLSLSMVIHELATNAVKHGSLSKPEGVLELTWELANVGGKDWVRLSWSERNGLPVSKPGLRGFGTKLIERSATQDLGGKVRLDFAPEGFRCFLEFPLDQGAVTIMEKAVRAAHGVV
jgi:PAS domain S-box-containing protein